MAGRALVAGDGLEPRSLTLLRGGGDGASQGGERWLGVWRTRLTLQFGHRRTADRGGGGPRDRLWRAIGIAAGS